MSVCRDSDKEPRSPGFHSASHSASQLDHVGVEAWMLLAGAGDDGLFAYPCCICLSFRVQPLARCSHPRSTWRYAWLLDTIAANALQYNTLLRAAPHLHATLSLSL